MNELILAGKVVSLWLLFYYGVPWFGKAFRGQAIAATQTAALAAGAVGFITLQWLL